MSTRATYCFAAEWHPKTTFYIHYDGYPEGAAKYFQAMLDREGNMETHNHGLAEVFFRANDLAEFTGSHESHGDTEFRYDVRSRALTAYKRYRSEDGFKWQSIFTGTVEEFVAKYARKESHA